MHYIRLLRPPEVDTRVRQKVLKLVLTITTDLGDAYLQPPAPLHLQVVLLPSGVSDNLKNGKDPSERLAAAKRNGLVWKAGMRVLKVDYPLPASYQVDEKQEERVTISPLNPEICATKPTDITDGSRGRIMPVTAILGPTHPQTNHISIRRLQLSATGRSADLVLELEEDLGDSIARHVWDGGLTAVAFLADLCLSPSAGSGKQPSLPATRDIICQDAELKILELGSGVGTLGLGLAMILQLHQKHRPIRAKVLLTDVSEAQERASANIRRWETAARSHANMEAKDASRVSVDYEVLDWEDGRQGRFGSKAGSEMWDLVVLSDCTYNTDSIPLLVETLDALGRHLDQLGSLATRVLLATKPRHDSETLAFEMLDLAGWKPVENVVVPLPMIGAEDQEVQIYLFQKLATTEDHV
jgi:hypothetical protein